MYIAALSDVEKDKMVRDDAHQNVPSRYLVLPALCLRQAFQAR